MKVQLSKRPSLDQVVQQVSLLVEVAGLQEEWVEVKRHPVKLLSGTRASSDEALSSKESQRLHVSWFDFQQNPRFQTADVGSAWQCLPSNAESLIRLCVCLVRACCRSRAKGSLVGKS